MTTVRIHFNTSQEVTRFLSEARRAGFRDIWRDGLHVDWHTSQPPALVEMAFRQMDMAKKGFTLSTTQDHP